MSAGGAAVEGGKEGTKKGLKWGIGAFLGTLAVIGIGAGIIAGLAFGAIPGLIFAGIAMAVFGGAAASAGITAGSAGAVVGAFKGAGEHVKGNRQNAAQQNTELAAINAQRRQALAEQGVFDNPTAKSGHAAQVTASRQAQQNLNVPPL